MEEPNLPSAPLFISFTASDLSWAKWVEWQLRQLGYATVMQPYDHDQGGEVDAQITDSIAKCALVIVLLSPAYEKSVWCAREWERADQLNKIRQLVVRSYRPAARYTKRAFKVIHDKGELESALTLRQLIEGTPRPEINPGLPSELPVFPGKTRTLRGKLLLGVSALSLAAAGAFLATQGLRTAPPAREGALPMREPERTSVNIEPGKARGDAGAQLAAKSRSVVPRMARLPRPSSFEMDRTEVTVAQYAECVQAGGCQSEGLTERSVACHAMDAEGRCNWGQRERAGHPINCVSYWDARDYCQWLGKRLPTNEEWTWAARGDDLRRYPWGNGAAMAQHGNIHDLSLATMVGFQPQQRGVPTFAFDDGFALTAPVGSFPNGASAHGLLDMFGNVSEWTWEGALRGGSYVSKGEWSTCRGDDGACLAMISKTEGLVDEIVSPVIKTRTLNDRVPTQGFRCVRSRVQPPESEAVRAFLAAPIATASELKERDRLSAQIPKVDGLDVTLTGKAGFLSHGSRVQQDRAWALYVLSQHGESLADCFRKERISALPLFDVRLSLEMDALGQVVDAKVQTCIRKREVDSLDTFEDCASPAWKGLTLCLERVGREARFGAVCLPGYVDVRLVADPRVLSRR